MPCLPGCAWGLALSDSIEAYMRHCLRQDVLQGESYQTASVPDGKVVSSKLDAAECPYDPVPEYGQELLQEVAGLELNRYPSGDAAGMLQALREYFAVPDEYSMLPGNGSDELIQIIATAVSAESACAVAPDPSFVMYRKLSALARLKYVAVPLQRDSLTLDVPAMCAAIKQHRPAVVWLANPNNPTGVQCEREELEQIIAAAPGAVVVDEAYSPYAERNVLQQDLPPNVLVLRTLSKIGLAGLRVGALIAHEPWVRQLDKVRLPYNMGASSQKFATTMLQQAAVINSKVQLVLESREQLRAELEQAGCKVWPSATNFLLIRVEDANKLHAALAEQGVATKNMHGSHELLSNCIRVTVGTPQQNAELLRILRSVI